ncbi:MAG: hypothetical protein KatS3mg113_0581 [Planctomycetaceae bacterium]|nr:MAG: hypothetical protein KatS3mg113_0581 [Planctomycetaceae bacterium]
MQQARWWLVCYDVHDEKRLRQCAKHLEGYGSRVQYSLFRCWLTPAQLECLRWELTEILTPEDNILFIPLCPRCLEGITSIFHDHRPDEWTSEPPTCIII